MWIGGISGFLAVGGGERFDVVADEGGGVGEGHFAVEDGFVADGVDEGEG